MQDKRIDEFIPRPSSAIELSNTIGAANEIMASPNLAIPEESGKAHYYSQLSVMLFEKAASENDAFPEDLDRVHSWFTTELTDAQRLVCLHDLLSMLSPSQHRFLFTSVAFDTQTNEDDTIWLDLAMSESQKMHRSMTNNSLDDRLSRLDLSGGLLGENLFSGLQVNSSKSSTGSISISRSNESNSEQVSLRSLSPLSSTQSSRSSSKVLSILKVEEDSTIEPEDNFTLDQPIPIITTNLSNSSSSLSEASKKSLSLSAGKAPPGFLSPNATEFRPSEPSCHPEEFMKDFGQWLRLLRLHKYQKVLQPVYDKSAELMLKMSDEELEKAGVAALGARRKFLRLFERIREELEPPK